MSSLVKQKPVPTKKTLKQIFDLDFDLDYYLNAEKLPLIEAKHKAWFGDSLLSFFVSQVLWERYPKQGTNTFSDGVTDENEEEENGSIEVLTTLRKKYTSNKNLSRFLEVATLIPATYFGTSAHSAGTVFEWLLCLSYEKSHDAARRAVNELITYIDSHPQDFLLPSSSFEEFTVFQVDNTTAIVEAKVCDEEFKFTTNEFGQNISVWISKCIKKKQQVFLSESLEKKAFREKEHKKNEDEMKRRWLKEQSEKTRVDPFHGISLQKPQKNTTTTIAITLNKSCIHSGDLLPINWVSGQGYHYTDYFYSCCGLRKNETHCNITNWPSKEQHNYHCGALYLYSSKRQPGGRGPIGSSLDHVPICKIPKWKCCQKFAYEPGCKSREKISSRIGGLEGKAEGEGVEEKIRK